MKISWIHNLLFFTLSLWDFDSILSCFLIFLVWILDMCHYFSDVKMIILSLRSLFTNLRSWFLISGWWDILLTKTLVKYFFNIFIILWTWLIGFWQGNLFGLNFGFICPKFSLVLCDSGMSIFELSIKLLRVEFEFIKNSLGLLHFLIFLLNLPQ